MPPFSEIIFINCCHFPVFINFVLIIKFVGLFLYVCEMEMLSRLIDRFNCKCYVHRCYTAAFKHTRMRHRLLSIRQPLIVNPAFQGEMKGVIVILILFLLNFFVSFLAAAHCGSVESSFIKQKYFKKFPSQGKRIHYIQETNIRL